MDIESPRNSLYISLRTWISPHRTSDKNGQLGVRYIINRTILHLTNRPSDSLIEMLWPMIHVSDVCNPYHTIPDPKDGMHRSNSCQDEIEFIHRKDIIQQIRKTSNY